MPHAEPLLENAAENGHGETARSGYTSLIALTSALPTNWLPAALRCSPSVR